MKKGFTLIELLAVIVILAIIAVIAVPIVISIIDESKKNASLQSAEMYLDAVELSLTQEILIDDKYIVNSEGNLCRIQDGLDCNNSIEIDTNGQYPTSGSIIEFENKKVTTNTFINYDKYNLYYRDGKLELTTKPCFILKGDINTIGSEVACGSEHFYIVPQDKENHSGVSENTVSLLTKYNLNIGNYKYPNIGTFGIQEKNTITKNEEQKYYGRVQFSQNMYWDSNNSANLFIYNENSSLSQYLENYKQYLKQNVGVENALVTLLSLKQVQDLGIVNESTYNDETAFEWAYLTSYWLGTTKTGTTIRVVSSARGYFGSLKYDQVVYGVRPVIIIDKGLIE